MTAKRIVAAIVFVDFLALNAWALYRTGLQGFVDLLMVDNPWMMVAAADVLIALTMVVLWMWSDARRSGRQALGYTLMTYATGSLGPLLYVLLGKDTPDGA